MGFVEIQFDETTFLVLTTTLASMAPNPFATFDFLPAKQLVRSLAFGGGDAGYGPTAGLSVGPGELLVSLPVTIGHVSIDELAANPAAPGGTTAATFWCRVAAPGTALAIDVLRIDSGATKHTPAAPVPLGTQAVPLPLDVPVTAAGLVRDAAQRLVVFRVATSALSAQILTAAGVTDRRAGNNWAIFLGKSALVDVVLAMIAAQLGDNLPSDIQIEEQPTAAWTAKDGAWGLDVSAGLLAIDACPAVLGDDVDMSVELIARLGITATLADQLMHLRLHVSHDVSDWDSFRCALQNFFGGLVLIVYGLLTFSFDKLWLGMFGTLGLIGIPIIVGAAGGSAVADQSLDGFTKQHPADEGDDATFTQDLPLPALPNAAVTDAIVDGAGVTIRGAVPIVAPGHHAQTVKPSKVGGAWYSSFSCSSLTWDKRYQCGSVKVKDVFSVGDKAIAKPDVKVFSTTEVRPASAWTRTISSSSVGPGFVQVAPVGDPAQGTTGTLFVHTSAGLTVVDLKAVPAPPAPPSAMQVVQMKADCQKATWKGAGSFDLRWLVDPPPDTVGDELIRQWLVQVAALPLGAAIGVAATGAGPAQEARVIGRGQRAIVELTTLATQGARLTVEGRVAQGQVDQRLLQVVHALELGAPIVGRLVRSGDGGIAALTGRQLVTIDPRRGTAFARASRGAIGLVGDRGAIVVYGPEGAARVQGRTWQPLLGQQVDAVERVGGDLVLHAASGPFALRSGALTRLGVSRLRPGAAATPAMQTLSLDGHRVVVAHGSTVLVTEVVASARDVHAI